MDMLDYKVAVSLPDISICLAFPAWLRLIAIFGRCQLAALTEEHPARQDQREQSHKQKGGNNEIYKADLSFFRTHGGRARENA
jgi:hypothetical protein